MPAERALDDDAEREDGPEGGTMPTTECNDSGTRSGNKESTKNGEVSAVEKFDSAPSNSPF